MPAFASATGWTTAGWSIPAAPAPSSAGPIYRPSHPSSVTASAWPWSPIGPRSTLPRWRWRSGPPCSWRSTTSDCAPRDCPSWRSCVPHGRASWRSATPSDGAWSGTSTMVCSSSCWPSCSIFASPGWRPTAAGDAVTIDGAGGGGSPSPGRHRGAPSDGAWHLPRHPLPVRPGRGAHHLAEAAAIPVDVDGRCPRAAAPTPSRWPPIRWSPKPWPMRRPMRLRPCRWPWRHGRAADSRIEIRGQREGDDTSPPAVPVRIADRVGAAGGEVTAERCQQVARC